MSLLLIIALSLLGLFVIALVVVLFFMLCCMAGDFGYYDWPEHQLYRRKP